MSSPAPSRRDGGKDPQLCMRFLAVAICALAVMLIIQVVILVRNAASSGESGGVVGEDGSFATAVTSCGFVKGLVVNGSYEFLGLQYALPPLGRRRWAEAEVHDDLDQCWNGTYFAIERRKRCWQFYRNGSYDGAEDCLYLDVFTPKLNYQNPLDVVVFVGGDNLNGGESFDLQPSALLAKERNAVFVSVSFRRSILGFLSLKTLSQKSPTKSSGNYGISDLFAALLWIRRNIQHFGGNPQSVTILAHQSGATMLGALLRAGGNSGGSPLFHKVWMSGGKVLEPVSVEQADHENLNFLEYTECESLECLYKLSPEELLESLPFTWRQFHHELPSLNSSPFEQEEHFWLVYDGHILRDPKNETKQNVQIIPLVIGAPQHVDASSEMRSHLNWNSTEKYRKYLESSFDPAFAVQSFHQYNRPDTNHWQQFSALLTDYRTICPMLRMSRKYFQTNLAFNYITTHRTKEGGFGNLAKVGSDIHAIFRVYTPRSVKEAKFKENMISMFDSFIKTGLIEDIPGGRQGHKILMVDDRIGRVQEYSNCDLWYRYYELKKPNPSPTRFLSFTTTTTTVSTPEDESSNVSSVESR